jgi:hypothetical protein
MVWIMTSIGEGYERDLIILSLSLSYLESPLWPIYGVPNVFSLP